MERKFEFLCILIVLLRTGLVSAQAHSNHDSSGLLKTKGSKLTEQTSDNQVTNDQESDVWSMVASMNNQDSAVKSAEYLANGTQVPGSFDWSVALNQEKGYELGWRVNYELNQIILHVSIDEQQSDFRRGSDVFALGFSSNGSLELADFCLLWYDLSHNLHLQDARTNLNNQLKLADESTSQCKLISTELKTGRTKFKSRKSEKKNPLQYTFTRPLDVCESELGYYYHIDNGTSHLIWFTIRGPLLSLDGLDLNQLKQEAQLDGGDRFNWGFARVQLISSKRDKLRQTSHRKDPTKSLAIRVEKFRIPAKETTYWCKLFKLPSKFHSHKYHITKYEAVVEHANRHIVHHMELFNCANLVNSGPIQEVGDEEEEQTNQLKEMEMLYANGGWSGECGDSSKRPAVTQSCKKVIMAWAMGAQPLEYPPEVGQSIGGPNYDQFVMLEIHYNNVNLEANLVDNSGLQFHYTNRLRQFEAGILEVGLEYTDKYAIPPGMTMPLAGHCVSECTRIGLSSESGASSSVKRNSSLGDGIFIFAAQLHTHLAGVASWTEIIREGKLLGELQRDNHYSPHFQEIRLLPEVVQLIPGDSLRHYCLYDTRARDKVTLGGEATTDEMCVTYLHYYPRVDLEVCKSSVDSSALELYFAQLALEERQNTSKELKETHSGPDYLVSCGGLRKSVDENYRSIEWNRKRAEELLRFYAEAPQSIQCNRSNGDRFPGPWNGYFLPVFDHQAAEVADDGQGSVGAPSSLGPIAGVRFEAQLRETGRELMAYRGRGFGERHAQCAARATKFD